MHKALWKVVELLIYCNQICTLPSSSLPYNSFSLLQLDGKHLQDSSHIPFFSACLFPNHLASCFIIIIYIFQRRKLKLKSFKKAWPISQLIIAGNFVLTGFFYFRFSQKEVNMKVRMSQPICLEHSS